MTGGIRGNRMSRTFILFWICRQIGIVSTCKRVCLRPAESTNARNDGVEVRILSYPQMGLVSALNRALSKYSSAKEKQIMEIATIRS